MHAREWLEWLNMKFEMGNEEVKDLGDEGQYKSGRIG